MKFIFKVLSIGFLFILGGFLFGGVFSIFKYLIVTVTTFVMIYLISKEMYWNAKRSKTDWDRINWE